MGADFTLDFEDVYVVIALLKNCLKSLVTQTSYTLLNYSCWTAIKAAWITAWSCFGAHTLWT